MNILENRAIIQLATLGKVEAGIFRKMQIFRSCSLCRSCSEKGDFILADNIYFKSIVSSLSYPHPHFQSFIAYVDCILLGKRWEWHGNEAVTPLYGTNVLFHMYLRSKVSQLFSYLESPGQWPLVISWNGTLGKHRTVTVYVSPHCNGSSPQSAYHYIELNKPYKLVLILLGWC